jgi:hypothetical protein
MTKPIATLALICLALSPAAHAATQYFCPSSNQYINLGASIAEARAKCGPPHTATTSPYTLKKTRLVDQWVYNYQPNTILRFGTIHTRKGALVVNFINNKVIEILVNGHSVASTNFCSNNLPVKVGDNNLTIRQLCDQPTIIQKTKQTISQQKTQKVVWTYQANDYIPANTLTFISGKLVSIQ